MLQHYSFGDLEINFITSLESQGLYSFNEGVNLVGFYDLPYDRICMHEVVFSAKTLQKQFGISALDISKRLIDYGIHPPTMYFPLIVEEALMVEPTETESKETMDYFISVMKPIADAAKNNPDLLKIAPHYEPNTRLDEARAARKPELRWKR